MKKVLKYAALCGPLLAFLILALPSVFAQPWVWGEPRSRWEERPRQDDRYYDRRRAERHPRCRQLEDELAGGWARNMGAQDQLPKLDAEIEQVSRDHRRAKADAERADCYEDMFIFGRSLRQSRRCIELDGRVEALASRLKYLRAQRDSLVRSTDVRARKDEILAQLARYDCGEAYAREYRSRNVPSFFDLWSDEDSDDDQGSGYPTETLPYESYRTVCVRLCDGFFFPVSYSTLPSRFPEDEAKCQSQCAAPSELFYHRVRDQDMEHAVSISGKPYTSLPNAFRHRKVYIKGCSCNASEYSREEIAKAEEALRQQTAAAQAASRKATDAPAPAPAAAESGQPSDNAPADADGQAEGGEAAGGDEAPEAPRAESAPPSDPATTGSLAAGPDESGKKAQ